MPLELMSMGLSAESVMAAVRAGADSVCLAAPDCGQNKECLSLSDLLEAIKYCRLRGVKAYVGFSACVTDDELPRLKTVAENAYKCGADAAVVQDIGLARMLMRLCPELPVFGGEGLAVHSLAGALAAQKMGLSRVTLAKELSLEQIGFICKRCETETMLLCHGSICASYSGQCSLSAAVNARPAMRGGCTQPCRNAYSYVNERPAAHLSLKDVCLAGHIQEIKNAGVTAVYIEAAHKSPEYVALTTALYKETVSSSLPPPRSGIAEVQSIFSRDGFTDGYFTGKKGISMFGVHDELTEREARQTLSEVRKMYITDPEPPLVPICVYFTAKADKGLRLTCRDNEGNEYTAASQDVQPAKKSTADGEIEEILRRTDRTVYTVEDCVIDIDEGIAVSPTAVNSMRRLCLEGLNNRRRVPPERTEGDWQPGVKRVSERETPGYTFSFLKAEQITPQLLDFKPEIVYLPLFSMQKKVTIIETLKQRGITPCASLDRVIFDKEWSEVLLALRELKACGLEEVLCSDLGQITLLSPLGFRFRTDFGLGAINSQTVRTAKDFGALSCTVSYDMSLAKIRELSAHTELEAVVYGRLPLMITENCLIHKRNGVHSCQTRTTSLTDKTGKSYPLFPEKGCRNTLYNAEKLWLADKTEDFEKSGLSLLRLSFTTENSSECLQVVRAYAKKSGDMPERATRGMYYRTF